MSSSTTSSHFRVFIRGLLLHAGIKESRIELLTDDYCMKEFTKSFTHKSIDPVHNYEYYETLGDVTSNKIVVWYFHRRFPDLFNNPEEGGMGPVAGPDRQDGPGVVVGPAGLR